MGETGTALGTVLRPSTSGALGSGLGKEGSNLLLSQGVLEQNVLDLGHCSGAMWDGKCSPCWSLVMVWQAHRATTDGDVTGNG